MSALSYYNEPAPLAWDVAAAIFGADGVGGMYDPSDLSTVFQSNTGGLPAAPGSPVGLVLDARQELGPELVGTLDFTVGWSLSAGVTVTSPNSVQKNSTLPGGIYRNYLEIGKVYQVTVSYGATGEVEVRNGISGSDPVVFPAAASRQNETAVFVANRTSLYFRIVTSEDTMENVALSIREVLNPPLSQPTTAARPTLQSPGLRFDLADDALTTTLPQAVNGDLLIAGTKGSIIEPVNYASGSTFTLGPDTYTGGTPGIMRAIGDIVGVVLIDRTLTQTEREVLIEHYKGKGAKGLLVPGPDVAWSNGTLSVSDFSPQNEGSFLIEDDGENIKITRLVATGSGRVFLDTAPVTIGPNRIQFTITEISTDARGFYAATNGGATGVFANTYPSTPVSFDGVYNLTGGGNGRLRFHFSPCRGADANVGEVGDYMKLSKVISVRELRPQEDWT